MTPIDPAELSALLDGELPSSRADEIRAALAQDPQLRKTFDQLVALDADWQARASAAMFQPRVHLEESAAPGRWMVASAISILVVLRLALKFQSPPLATGVELLLLLFFVGWGLRKVIRATDVDCTRLALAAQL